MPGEILNIFLLIDITDEHDPKNTTIIAGSTAAHINYGKHWLIIPWNLTTTMIERLHERSTHAVWRQVENLVDPTLLYDLALYITRWDKYPRDIRENRKNPLIVLKDGGRAGALPSKT